MGISCGAEEAFYNMIASHSFNGSISLCCDFFHKCFLAFPLPLGETGNLEGPRLGKMPFSRVGWALVKCFPWRVGFCHAVGSGCFSELFSSPHPDKTTRSFSGLYCRCLEKKSIKICTLPSLQLFVILKLVHT